MRTYVKAAPDMRRLLDDSRAYGDRTFLVFEDERISFQAHWRAAHAFGTALVQRYGVRKGDRIAIALRNFPEWSACAWGALAVGAVLVPLNAWETGPNLAAMLRDCGAIVAVVDEERLQRLRNEKHSARIVRARCAGEGDSLETLIGHPGEWDTLPAAPSPDRALTPDDPATIFYTSGTTGQAKGALGTHRNIATNIVNTGFRAARAALRRTGQLPAPSCDPRVQLLPLPFFHVTGFHSTLAPALANGVTVVLMYKWNVEKALQLIELERINALGLVPALATQLVDAIGAGAQTNLCSVDTVGYGGSAASSSLASAVRQHFPSAWPGQGYGATETSSLVAVNSHEDMLAQPDSVGPATPCTDIRVVGESGRDVVTGDVGELWVRGPQVVTGYWNNPEATAAAFPNGWYRTGDVVAVAPDGFIRVKDRIKDMVIRGGENIYCAEIEGVLENHPSVLECAVFGLPDSMMGEIVAAVVRVRPGKNAAIKQLAGHCAGMLSAFKVPEVFDLVDEPLPRNAAGKVMKREVREALLGRRDASSARS